MPDPIAQPGPRRPETELKAATPRRLAAIDLDGTLLQPDGSIAATDRAAIRDFRAAGHAVVLATARPPRISRDLHASLGLDTPSVHYNGAVVLDGDGGTLTDHRLDPALARAVAALAREQLAEVVLDVEADDAWHTDRLHPRLHTRISATGRPDRQVANGDLDALFDRPITKLMLVAEPASLDALRPVLDAAFGSDIGIAVSDPHLLQVLNPAATKAAGVAVVAERLGVRQAEVIAIGDAPNDLEMLAWAGTGVAVPTAWPEVRAAADRVATVAEVLRAFGAGRGT